MGLNTAEQLTLYSLSLEGTYLLNNILNYTMALKFDIKYNTNQLYRCCAFEQRDAYYYKQFLK